ncbi:MAG: single-stranded-DNA-specific exonuclease RecJ [Thermoanaerobaculia bacterium]
MSIFHSWAIAEPVADGPYAIPAVSPIIRSLLIRRGVTDERSYRRFVSPELADLHDPSSIHGIDYACDRIARAIADGEGILIYGDYDVDGVTSIVMLQTVIRLLGGNVGYVVPDRLIDGYGLKQQVLDRVLEERDVRLVITVDCGITSVKPVQYAVERGLDVIITDHHLPPGVLPSAAAVLNPKQPGCGYPFKDLAGVGVAFKLCCELIRRSGRKIAVDSLLKLAAIGTVADVAPLVGENRSIVQLGLAGLSDVRNRGLRALLKRLGLEGRPVRASDIGFKIGPRINAAGRLALATTAIELFEAADDDTAWQLCTELDRLNAERQQVEKQVRAEADQQVRGGERVLIVAGEGWHRGVVGLTAGRLAQQHYRPCLAIAVDGDVCVGSARSIPTVNLHECLSRASDLFVHFGGHELACGFAVRQADLPALRSRLTDIFAELDDSAFVRQATAEAILTLADLTPDVLAGLEMLEPHGSQNAQPLFVVAGCTVVSSREFSEDCRELIVRDTTGEGTAVLWPSCRQLAGDLGPGASVDLLCHIESSKRGARLVIQDARPA